MAETGKRIEVRCGAFACRVEGFDDPVGQLREVLLLMQRMIAETPALADQASGLDDAQLARIHDALSDRRAEGDTPGIVVIRSGEHSEDHVADAEILEEAPPDEPDEPDDRPEPRIDAPPGDTAPFPSAAVYAPAAAAAEAAFAARMADEDGVPPDEDHAQEPLGAELPDEPATSAALFAAPAAGLAETAFAGGLASAAEPADPDDDARDPDLAWADEAAEERAQTADAEQTALREAGGPGAEQAPRGLGGPGEGWTPWGSLPAHTAAPVAPPPETPGDPSEPASGETSEAPSADGRRAPTPGLDEAEGGAEPLPPVNIFAPPPPDDMPAPVPDEPETRADPLAAPRPEPPASLRRAPGPAAGDPEFAPDTPAREAAERRTGDDPLVSDDGADDTDEVLDDGAGDWRDAESPPESAENRLAALITRYQSGRDEPADQGPAPEDAGARALSAAELADRAEATEVADLLAASAAWLTLVDGRARFTRREVMEVFETLPGTHPRTLEARIKGFGIIVRSGTLQLVGDGAFALAPAERARFRALIDQG